MADMKAMEFNETLHLQPVLRPVPQPQAGEILVQVTAAGVTPTEKLWYPTTHNADGTPRSKAIPGHEFSGIVSAVGEGVADYRPGDRVYGMNDWFAEGATAEFCIAKPASLAPKPSSLSPIEAASTPISALTAWQGLHDHAKLQKSERVLIHGGAGAVGLFVVQLAKLQGAYVIATASGTNIDLVKQLGADEVIDYRQHRFEDAGKVDLVFDTVGGETLTRSWNLLRPNGRLVTIAADAEGSTEPQVKDAFFIVELSGEQLSAIGKLFESNQLKAFIKAELSLDEADHAYSGTVIGNPGKLVIRI